MAPKEKKTKLNLITDGPTLITKVQKECRSWQYDVKKVMTTLNCTNGQAQTLIALAQIEDAKQPAGKAATAR